jgi:hypothetical protein
LASAAAPLPTSKHYGSSFLLDAVESYQKSTQVDADPHAGLNRYLSTPPEPADNILHLWSVSPCAIYCKLQLKLLVTEILHTRDYFSIQGSATPAERQFGITESVALRSRKV